MSADPSVTLRHEADLPYVVEVDGVVVARCARWAHAMWLVEVLRTPRGRRSLERPEPLEVE